MIARFPGVRFSAICVLFAVVSTGAAAAEIGYLGLFGQWEAREFEDADGTQQCAVRAIHPDLVEGDIIWVFNAGARDRFPHGYLAVDRRLAGSATAVRVETDDGGRFDLVRGNDLHFYNAVADTQALFAAMVRGYRATVVLAHGDSPPTMIPLSLIGFTRAADVSREACGFQ